MPKKKRDVQEPKETTIAAMASALRVETLQEYPVAAAIEVDWCPCCGVNFRLIDARGHQIAKFIAGENARAIGAKIIRTAHERQAFADRGLLDKVYSDLRAAVEG